jgi:protoporphyrinogen/coproporphyrinogen III oxidase
MTTIGAHTAKSPHIIIVGGGIAGLSTAWYLQQQGISYTVLEKSDHWGGKIRTEIVETEAGQFVVEVGPDSFISQKPWAKQLAIEIGFEDQLLGTNDDKRETFVLNNSKLTPLPDGMMLIVPTRFLPFVMSPLISPLGKLRMGLEMFIPPKQDDEDESLAAFMRRRLGNEALDKLAEPLMAGIYNTDAEKQSLLATFPRFRTLERQYGSITKGMIAAIQQRKSNSSSKSSLFTSFSGGMQTFVDDLVEKLEGNLRLNTGVKQIIQDKQQYEVSLDNGDIIQGDVVVLATPAYVAADLLQDLSPLTAERLGEIRYLSTGTISLAFRKKDIPQAIRGFGVVIPRSEKRPINAITVSSTKLDYRAPEDCVLMRVFFGGSRSPQTMALSDDELLRVIQEQVHDLTGIEVPPLFTRIYRNHKANPQYDVGHLERLQIIDNGLPENIFLTGSAYRGVGVPDCVHQGQLTAQTIAEELPMIRVSTTVR